MKAVFLTLALSALLAFSCNDDNDRRPCNVENPVRDLSWLAEATLEMEQYDDVYVSQASYNKQTVFIFGNCCVNCNSVFSVYDCSGNKLGAIGAPFESSLLDNSVIIWKAHDSICGSP